MLDWDMPRSKFYEAGVSHGVLFVMGDDGVYLPGVAWPGLISVAKRGENGEEKEFYADGVKYASFRIYEKLSARLEAYIYPDQFSACEGYAGPEDGVLFSQQERTPFAMSWRSEIFDEYGSGDYKLHIIYGATAKPTEEEYQTLGGDVEAMTFSWDISTTPVPVPNYNEMGFRPTSSVVIDSRKCEKTALKIIEDMLYGADGESKLPLPEDIAEILG